MGFNITQIINKDLAVKPMQENPFGTAHGQSAVSVAESFWSRLSREGIMVAGYKQDHAITDTITSSSEVLKVGIGRRLYVSRLIFSSNVDARGVVKVDYMKYYKQEAAGATTLSETFWMPFYVRAMGTVELKFDGDFWIEEGMSLTVRGQTLSTGATGKMDFFGMGWEVAVSA